ncbi:MAG: OapA N-terminal domain-containing protein [Saprospiraceae bacterium]
MPLSAFYSYPRTISGSWQQLPWWHQRWLGISNGFYWFTFGICL